MNLFQILHMHDPKILSEQCKIHLAGWNGSDDPLEVYLSDNFDEWQSWQSKKNFERPLVRENKRVGSLF